VGGLGVEQILALAPDAASVKAARGLARPGPWSDTGATETLLWGSCQGSGKKPYQVSVDLTGPSAKCSCPSRKFPCKHGLALLLLWAGGHVGAGGQVAGFAAEWVEEREARAEKAQAKAAAPKAPPDPKAQAARRASRERLISAGLDDLDVLLADVVRQGLAAARNLPFAFWDGAARRLVDAQAPAIGNQVRELAGIVAAGDPEGAAVDGAGWAGRALAEMGRLHLAVEAWRRRDALPAPTRADLDVFLGVPVPTEVVREGLAVTDAWLVLGVREDEDARIRSQRTWLRGLRTGSFALLLDFAAGGQPMPVANVVGSLLHAEVFTYPGTPPCRVLVNGPVRPEAETGLVLSAATSTADRLATGLERVGTWRAANPFAGPLPLHVRDVQVLRHPSPAGSWTLLMVDEDGVLPARADAEVEQVLARTGGAPVTVVGEHTEQGVHLLSVHAEAGAPMVPL
jgi:hypothetical protein